MANYFNTLTNRYGDPAVAVLVRMHDYYTGVLKATTTTNEFGQFSFSNIPEGTYDFRLYGENFTEVDWIYEVHVIDAVDNSGRTQNLDKDSGNFVTTLDGLEYVNMVDAGLGTVSAKNIGRPIWNHQLGIYGESEVNDYIFELYYGINNPGFSASSPTDWYAISYVSFTKFPSDDYVVFQGMANTKGWDVPFDIEAFILGGTDLRTVLVSGITYSGTYGTPLLSGALFSLSISIAGLVDYATFTAGCRGRCDVDTSPERLSLDWLNINVGSTYTFNVSGVYSPGDPDPPEGGGGGKPPPPVFEG